MKRRFSDEELYNVRNRIPIRQVIESFLAIPSETVHGIFRFRCPLCAGRHTAIKPETNLARCFDCRKNFNAIDLCMLTKHIDFVESVKSLASLRATHRQIGQEDILAAEVQAPSAGDRNHAEPPREISPKPVALGDILSKLINGRLEKDPKNQDTAPQAFPLPEDIAELEHIVHALSQILQRLKSNYHNPA